MSTGEQFSLVWNTFPRNLSSGLYSLLTGEQLVDVTLAAEGQILRAHKLILSVCSSYFRDLFKGNTCKHPIVILKDVNYRDLSAMLHFMYQGEVSIKQEDIASFLKVAEILKIKGLTRTNDDDDEGEKDLVDALPLIQHDRGSGAPPAMPPAHAGEQQQQQQQHQFCEQPSNKPGWPCQCSAAKPTSEEVSVVRSTFRDPLEAARVDGPDDEENDDDVGGGADLEVDNDEPLDCSVEEQPKPEYKPEPVSLEAARRPSPELECAQRLTAGQLAAAHCEQESVEGMLGAQLVGYSAPHCQAEPVGFHDTGTGTTCAPSGDFSHEASTSCNAAAAAAAASKGRRTVKGLPGSSLSLETTLRVISELGPTIRMERGKVIRMYSCPWCLRHFTRKENLKLHVRYIHGPLESLTCKLCGNKYKNSNSLRVHSYLYHNAQRNNKSSPASSTSSTSASGGNKPPILGGNA